VFLPACRQTGLTEKWSLKEKLLFSPSSLIFLSLIIKGKRNCAFFLFLYPTCSLRPLRLLSKLLRFRTLWAYGFDSAAPRAPEKSKVGEKEKYFISFNQLYFLKSRLRSAIKTGESHPERAWS